MSHVIRPQSLCLPAARPRAARSLATSVRGSTTTLTRYTKPLRHLFWYIYSHIMLICPSTMQTRSTMPRSFVAAPGPCRYQHLQVCALNITHFLLQGPFIECNRLLLPADGGIVTNLTLKQDGATRWRMRYAQQTCASVSRLQHPHVWLQSSLMLSLTLSIHSSFRSDPCPDCAPQPLGSTASYIRWNPARLSTHLSRHFDQCVHVNSVDECAGFA